MNGWKFAHIGADGAPFQLLGINPWQHEWQNVDGELIILPHPSHPAQMHQYRMWEIQADGKVVIFAACEVSNCTWAFYTPHIQ